MSRLPNAGRAAIDKRKITDYLLSKTETKAAFFYAFGFDAEKWRILHDALLRHAQQHDFVSMEETTWGRKYIIDGPIGAPDGRKPWVRAVWMIDAGKREPRFLTAYPCRRIE